MAKRTAIMHSDFGFVAGGPDGQRVGTVSELITAVQALYPTDPVSIMIACELSETLATVTVPANMFFFFTGSGSIRISAGKTVFIQNCVMGPVKQLFWGDVRITGYGCMQHTRWFGNSGGWMIPTITGDVLVEGDINVLGFQAQAAQIAGQDILTVMGGQLVGPLYLAQSPLTDMEAATRRWVLDMIGEAKPMGNYFSTIHLTDYLGGESILTSQKQGDTLVIHFCEDTVQGSPMEAWLEAYTNEEIHFWRDAGVSVGTCT